jgi:uncharacterized cupin superfamily protein
MTLEVGPGGSPSDRHEHEDEAWYVLDGHLTTSTTPEGVRS